MRRFEIQLSDIIHINVVSLTSAAKVDLVPLKPDPFAQTEFNRRQSLAIGADKFGYVTPEDYVVAKLKTYVATNSERQWHDLKNVVATQKKLGLDLYARVG